MLSHFSRVRLCATPETAAHQAPPSLGFSRQEHWSGLPFPSPVHESESEVAQQCPTLSDPMDCSLPGSSVYGIFQAIVLGWGAIAFSRFHRQLQVISKDKYDKPYSLILIQLLIEQKARIRYVCLEFFFWGGGHAARGISVPQPGIEPRPWQ